MTRICFVQKILKDKNFDNETEKINFQILKAFGTLPFETEVICSENKMEEDYNIKKIFLTPIKNFDRNAENLIRENNYDIIISTDYRKADILYLDEHTVGYVEDFVKTPLIKFLRFIFNHKKVKELENKEKKENLYLNKAQIILTPSSILKNDFINTYNIDGQKIFILPPTCKAQQIEPLMEDRPFTFGFIGKKFAEQGGFILLKAISKLKEDFKVKILYNQKLSDKMQKTIQKLKLENKIEFVYNITSEEFYKSIDCLVMPSLNEPFGLAALEIMAKGKIVLVSSRCGIKDIIEHDNNGFIFDITQNPVRNLYRTMKYILSTKNDFENMQQKAIYTASVYNIDKLKDELLRIFNSNFDTKASEECIL